ncbi:conjugal transfer protein TrbL family protein [Paenibacillus sp. GCM10012307]|uniref:Conjugation protein n=1 Tax=Paenibacillus roseus TaxID=2798579 RepID=A0A934MN11_9BACL|nr:conjugal transfer protein TrbL family protein [Paenibacillus roseus]MBJ6360506.1 conjugation protein [Paenibacillus roseus]
MSWLINEAIENYIKGIIEQGINFFLQFLNAINGMAGEVLGLPVVTQAIIFSQALAGTILVSKIAFEAWMTYIMRMSGDPDADPGGLLIRSMASAAIISSMPWLVKWFYEFGTAVAGDVAKLPGVDLQNAATPMERLLNMATGGGGQFIFFVFLGIIFAVIVFIIILIQTFLRAAELAVAAIIGSFMALGLTNSNSQAFGAWFKELLTLCMAQAIQMVLVKISFFTLTDFNFGGGTALFSLFLFCGFLWVTYKSPSILKQYIHSTGVGKVAGGAAQSVGSMVLMRRFLK